MSDQPTGRPSATPKYVEPQEITVFTGFTPDELLKHRSSRGANPGVGLVCYVCKRMDGDESVKVDRKTDEIYTSRISVENLSSGGGRHNLVFPLCIECILLLITVRRETPKEPDLPTDRTLREDLEPSFDGTGYQ